MIEVKVLSHKYKSKSGEIVAALNDVSISFPDTGMFFLTGKSGSGKSTLLNLLGGLDKIQRGDIVVGGKSFRSFNTSDYDNYRATYCGTIFQELNLINSLTVSENLSLQLRLANASGNDNSEAISNALKKVDLEGYEKRYPTELSGGQKQRISIARALCKGARVIFADEPTGNLDSENGGAVFSLLKKLSSEVLVVVVSHDSGFADKFGDTIVCLEDGKITRVVSKDKSIPNAVSAASGINKKKALPLRYSIKLSLNNIKRKVVRFSIASLLSAVALIMFCLSASVAAYNSERTIANRTVDSKQPYYKVFAQLLEGVYDDRNAFISGNIINELSSEYGSTLLKGATVEKRFFLSKSGTQKYSGRVVSVINSASDIEDILGYKMLNGYLPLDGESVYISDYYADGIINSEYLFANNSKSGICAYLDLEITDLIGATVFTPENLNNYVKIAGIFQTDYKDIDFSLFSEGVSVDSSNAEYYKLSQILNDVFNCFFVTENYFLNKNAERERIILASPANYTSDALNYYATANGKEVNHLALYRADKHFGVNIKNEELILTDNALFASDTYFDLSAKDIIISLDAYNILFDRTDDFSFYVETAFDGTEWQYTAKRYPSKIGESISIDYIDKYDSGVIYSTTYRIIGVSMEQYVFGTANFFSSYYLNRDEYVEVSKLMVQYDKLLLKTPSGAGELQAVLSYLRENKMLVFNGYSTALYLLENSLSSTVWLFLIFGAILLIFELIMFANFVAVSILSGKKDIGIIRSIGGSGSDIFKIYIFEGIIFSLISVLLGIAGSLVSTLIINSQYAVGILANLEIIAYYPLNLLILPVSSLLTMFASSTFPIAKISKQTPMDVIRSVN